MARGEWLLQGIGRRLMRLKYRVEKQMEEDHVRMWGFIRATGSLLR